MAKQYLVDQTVQYKDKAGKTISILRSEKPQEVPAGIAKEALARNLIRPEPATETEAAPAGDTTDTDPDAPGGEGGEGGGAPE